MFRPVILAAALLAPALAFAQTPLPPVGSAPETSTPPSVDGGYAGRPGGARMTQSPEMRQARQAMMQACSADLARFCADAGGDAAAQEGGGGRGARMQCLRQHMSDVSDGCRSGMQAMRAARQGGGAPPSATPPG